MLSRLLWNIAQAFREFAGLRPIGCACLDTNRCTCEPGQTYCCEVCKLQQPYCKGCWDEYFEICDDCYAIADAAHKAAGIPLVKQPTAEARGIQHS